MISIRTRRLILLLGSLLVLGAGGVVWLGYAFLSPDSALNRASAIDCTLTWGRLAPFPASAQQFTISVHGTMFTRAFRASFLAPPEEIEHWLRESPGTREAHPTTPSPGIRRFDIAPGGGAQHAEVVVDDTQHRVSVYVCWS